MMTSSNERFSACPWAENSLVTGEFPSQRPVTRSFDVFFDLCLNKRLSKQPRHRWFETPSRSRWRHCNELHHKDNHTSTSTRECVNTCKYACRILGISYDIYSYTLPGRFRSMPQCVNGQIHMAFWPSVSHNRGLIHVAGLPI